MAALRHAGEPVALHVHKAARGQAAVFDVIPRFVDDYLTFLEKYPQQEDKQKLANPVWHIHSGAPPAAELIGGDACERGHDPVLLDAAQSRRGGQFPRIRR